MKLRFFITPLSLLLSATLAHSQAQPSASVTPRGANNYDIDWAGVAGRSYFMQFSTDLVNWNYAPSMDYGAGAHRRETNSNSDKLLFIRLPYVDDPSINSLAAAEAADFDHDGISNLAELTSAHPTDPFNSAEPSDSDNDGMPNAWEVRYGLNPTNPADAAADANGDGITNLQSFLNGISPIGGGGNPVAPIEPELVMRGQSSTVYFHPVLPWLSLSYSSESLVRFHYPTIASYFIDPPYLRIEGALGTGCQYWSNEDSAGIRYDYFDGEPLSLWSLFQMPNASPDEDFSLWKKVSSLYLSHSDTPDSSQNFMSEYTFRSHRQIGLRLREPAQQAVTQTRTFLRVIETRPSGSNNKTTTLLDPPTQTMSFTIPAGRTASNVIDIHGPIPETAPEEGLSKSAYLLPVEVEWNIPMKNWENVGGHEESQNGEPSIIISIPEPWNDPNRIDELGLKLRCFSDRHLPDGTPENVNLMDYADTVFKTIGGELLVSFEHETLNRFGIIPDDETDSFAEYSYCDTATPESAGSNLADSHAFAAGISNGASNENGKAEGEGSLDDLIGKANREFMRHAGVDFIHFSFGGVETEKRQVRNQVEWFYYSGHGSHNSGELLLLDGNFSASDTVWNKELEAVILAGCSVLDIKDYRARSFGMLTYAKWLAAGGASSPGAQWETTGPKYLLGYAWAAPLDTQGADSIAADFTAGLNAGKHVITAWRDANDRGIARNACLIDASSSPPIYYYWDEQGENPVWTSVTKGAGGW